MDEKSIFLYWLTFSIIGVLLTVYDKIAAKSYRRRVRESVLMFFALLGGALPMYITMKTIRHKTLHKKFMIGLPLIMLLQASVIIFLIKKY